MQNEPKLFVTHVNGEKFEKEDSRSVHSFPRLSNSFRNECSDNSDSWDTSGLLLPIPPDLFKSYNEEGEEESQNLDPKLTRECSKSRRQFFKPLIAQLCEFCQRQKIDVFMESENIFHKQLALIILRRKLNLKDLEVPKTTLTISTKLLSLPLSKLGENSKRIEENNKFVFKHAIKLIKKNFKEKYFAKKERAQFEQNFLKHYFYRDEQCTLDPIYLTLLRSLQQGSKALSHSFYQSVFSNSQFSRDFMNVITYPSPEQSQFAKIYANSIYRKLLKLFRRWQPYVDNNYIEDQNQKILFNYFQTNKQCKLPWTLPEIVSAIKGFVRLIENLQRSSAFPTSTPCLKAF